MFPCCQRTSDLPSVRPLSLLFFISFFLSPALPVKLSAFSLPLTSACPGQYIHLTPRRLFCCIAWFRLEWMVPFLHFLQQAHGVSKDSHMSLSAILSPGPPVEGSLCHSFHFSCHAHWVEHLLQLQNPATTMSVIRAGKETATSSDSDLGLT